MRKKKMNILVSNMFFYLIMIHMKQKVHQLLQRNKVTV